MLKIHEYMFDISLKINYKFKITVISLPGANESNQWQWQNINQTLSTQKASHTSFSRESYGVTIATFVNTCILQNNYHVTRRFACNVNRKFPITTVLPSEVDKNYINPEMKQTATLEAHYTVDVFILSTEKFIMWNLIKYPWFCAEVSYLIPRVSNTW